MALTSLDFEWQPEGGPFEFYALRWGVGEAKRIVSTVAHPVEQLPLIEYKQLARLVTLSKVPDHEIDVTFPVLVVRYRRAKLPIDGWHRIAKGLKLGLETIPAIVLTVEESKRVKW